MKKLSSEKFIPLLEAGYELRNTEYKSPFNWKDDSAVWIREKVIKAVFAMTNTRLGGQIIIGIEEDTDKSIKLVGVSDEQFQSFKDYDSIKGTIDGFAFTNTDFDITYAEYDEKKYIIFIVQEFSQTPLICRKDGQSKGVLGSYDIYCRSKKAPYSSCKATDSELREMISMAVDKEESELTSRGRFKQSKTSADVFYNKQISDII